MSSKFEGFEHAPADQVWRRIRLEVEGDARPGSLSGHLGEFAHAPRAQVWDRIAAEVRPARRRAVVAWWLATAASVALLLVTGLQFGMKKGKEPQPKANSWSAAIPDDSTDHGFSGSVSKAGSGNGTTTLAQGNEQDMARNLREQGLSPLLFASVDDGGSLNHPLDEQDSWRIPRAILLASDTLPDSSQPSRYRFARKNREKPEKDNWDDLPPLPDRSHKVYAAAISSTFSPGGAIYNYIAAESDNNSSGFGGLGLSVANESYGDVEGENFSTPLVIGAQFRRGLSKRLSLGLGPVYTLMNSSWEETAAGTSDTKRIRRQYLGAALTANYEFLQSRRFSTYLTAGTQLDFGLDHQERVTTVTQSAERVDETNYYALGNQALATLGLGLDFNLTRQLGLYAQGTVMHAFYATHANLWTTRRFWPGMQVGLRLKL